MAEHPVPSPKPESRVRSVQSVDDFCRELAAFLQMDLEVEVREDNGVITVNLAGPDRPLLLSNSASVLNNIEYLLHKVFRVGKEDANSIVVDSDNYRQHREAELILLAQMASKKVISFRKPLNLQPMIARERRIVHLALADIEGVRSESSGEGESRSITIYPS